jgi:hypothetical protein
MKIYLDNGCFNRPYDKQNFETIRLESEAKLFTQEQIRDGKPILVWSFIVDFENEANPFRNQKESIAEWRVISREQINPSDAILKKAKEFTVHFGIKPKDALHLACAASASCDYFLSTDRQLLKKSLPIAEIKTINPIDFIQIVEAKNDL